MTGLWILPAPWNTPQTGVSHSALENPEFVATAILRWLQTAAIETAIIALSRIVLNLHYYEARLFEMVRVSFLLANRKCVVSESGNGPEWLIVGDVAIARAASS